MRTHFSAVANFIIIGFITCFFVSCQKDDIQQPKSLQLTEHTIQLTYVDNFLSTEFELIITDSLGKYLLDTILPVNKQISAKFLSDETKFNITTIEKQDYNGEFHYAAKTYYQVALKNWYINQYFETIPRISQVDLPEGPKINYTNIPMFNFLSGSSVYYSGVGAGWSSENGQMKSLEMDYRNPNPYYSYLLFPDLRLYKFHETKTNNDTVSLAKMDTALSITYKKDFELRNSFRELIGYKKKDDYSTYTKLWNGSSDPSVSFDEFIYPTKGVEQYLISMTTFDKLGSSHYSRVLADKMPDSLEFLDDSYVNTVKKDAVTYEIGFPKGAPTMYSFGTSKEKFNWEIMFPSNKTSFKGTDRIVDLRNSKIMKSFDFSNSTHYIKLLKADDYNFYDYLDVVFDPLASTSPQKISRYMEFATSKGL